MRHNRQTHKLSRNWSERKALLESLVSSLLRHQQIQTTLQKAKAAQRLADRIITIGKNETLAAKRQAFSYLQDHVLVAKLFKEIAPRFSKRKGGYTRIFKLSRRKGDGAEMALLELTEKEIKIKESKKKKDKKSGKLAPAKAPETVKPHENDAQEDSDKEKKAEAKPSFEKEAHPPKEPDRKKIHPPKGGFFKDLGKFFRNKGGA